MKKWFIVSDIHSFYSELKSSLKIAGYNKKNKDHILIVCGDLFDRGSESLKLFKFIQSIPKTRRILIRGNHEQLYLELLNKDFPESHDFSNGTVDTFHQIAHSIPIELLDEDTYNYDNNAYYIGSRKAWKDIVNIVKEHPITAWLKSDEWRNYYELDKYIFVHSFIPITDKKEYNPNWRNDTANWDYAVWGCPWAQYKLGLFEPEEKNNKVLVCGHWHTSDFFKKLKNIHQYDFNAAPIYYSKGLIGLDGGCQYDYYLCEYIHPQNVLVIDEKFNCYDELSKKLEEPNELHDKIIETVTLSKSDKDSLVDKFK